MGRGNVCTTGPYEGVFYIDNDDLRVYRRNDPYAKEEETGLQRDLSCEDLSGDEWLLDEIGSSYEEEDVLECFCAELRKLCPSFQPAANSNVWLGNERRVILENELFYICVEDNEWSLAVELVQKDGYSDCESAWMAGLQKRRYIDTQPEATPQEVAGQCWRNSKYDPPTEADADRLGRIIVWGAAVKHVDITYWENAIFHPVDVPFWMPLPVAPEEKAE